MNYDLVHEYDVLEKIPVGFPEHLMTKKYIVEAIEKTKELLNFDVPDEKILYSIAILEINAYKNKDIYIWDEPVEVIANQACNCVRAEIGWDLAKREHDKLKETEPVLIK